MVDRYRRRDFLTTLLLTGIAGLSASIAQPLQTASVSIQVDSQELQALGADRMHVHVSMDQSPAAEAMRSASPSGRAVPIIFIVVGVLSIPVLWRTIRSMFLQTYYGGVVIDTRANPISIVHEKAIPSGTVLVISKTGEAQRFDEQDFSENQLGSFVKPAR